MWLLMQKLVLKLIVILIEWMFPQDGQMLVDGFRYQNFGIWTIFGWVIAVLAKKTQFATNTALRVILWFIFTKNTITQPKRVQILKFLCLNPSTNICPSCGNIHSIKIMIYKGLMGEETFKTINFRPNFCITSHNLTFNANTWPKIEGFEGFFPH